MYKPHFLRRLSCCNNGLHASDSKFFNPAFLLIAWDGFKSLIDPAFLQVQASWTVTKAPQPVHGNCSKIQALFLNQINPPPIIIYLQLVSNSFHPSTLFKAASSVLINTYWEFMLLYLIAQIWPSLMTSWFLALLRRWVFNVQGTGIRLIILLVQILYLKQNINGSIVKVICMPYRWS